MLIYMFTLAQTMRPFNQAKNENRMRTETQTEQHSYFHLASVSPLLMIFYL